ncbi:MAG: hypothetical protein ABI665_28345 [Vicinamibacterales bacterium]
MLKSAEREHATPFDRVQKDDITQQGAVSAVFAWYAANWPEKLPRKAMPAKDGTAQ